MNWVVFWEVVRDILIPVLTTLMALVALIVALATRHDEKKNKKIEYRLNLLEVKLKQYEIEEMEQERAKGQAACVEARITNITKNNYRMKIWNSGKVTAYNVDYSIPEEANIPIIHDKSPYEVLESGKSYEENALVHMQSASKFTVTTTWEDNKGKKFTKEQITSI